MSNQIDIIQERVDAERGFLEQIRQQMARVVIGQTYLVDRLILGLLCDGHVLLEGVPGLAKTLSVKTLASLFHTKFQRLQFTPDLLPADLLGTLIYNPKDGDFSIRKGPIFANIILADEINRAPAKVQSALLEAMQERQVTIGDTTYPLPAPFLVLATENPIEQEGTYPLPEAQVDRFMFKLRIGYPSIEEERQIMERHAVTGKAEDLKAVVEPDQVISARKVVNQVYLDEKIKDYILSIIFATRDPAKYNLKLENYLRYGASPRATISLALAARAHAFLQGRAYVTPQDVKSMAPDVLRHRVLVTYEAEAEELDSDSLIQTILRELPVP
ncbi:MAG: MoxR family ATPase [Verrucomicrobia bacterium]|nr:MoxR family ATPase [Verrucomicrobiota bacterium]MCH8529177.1 MoxR family ATPase [Kiritimatiellia bacterium]